MNTKYIMAKKHRRSKGPLLEYCLFCFVFFSFFSSISKKVTTLDTPGSLADTITCEVPLWELKLSISFKSSTATLNKSGITCIILIKVTRKNKMHCVPIENSRCCFYSLYSAATASPEKSAVVVITESIQLLIELPAVFCFWGFFGGRGGCLCVYLWLCFVPAAAYLGQVTLVKEILNLKGIFPGKIKVEKKPTKMYWCIVPVPSSTLEFQRSENSLQTTVNTISNLWLKMVRPNTSTAESVCLLVCKCADTCAPFGCF